MSDLAPALWLPAAAIAAALLTGLLRLTLRLVFRTSPTATAVLDSTYRPAQVMAALAAARGAVALSGEFAWRDPAAHILVLAIIATAAWLATRLLYLLRRTAERAYDDHADADGHHRQRRTQITMMYRTVYSALWVMAFGFMFLTFPGASTIGASLLASAGVAGVIVGLAAQAMLKNLFAGMSLAFGDAISLGDIVEIEGEWGRVSDIALSYVVVRIWDDRRLVLPTSYFTDNPHRNWSRDTPELLGTVELDVGWRLPMDALRSELDRIVAASPDWDGRSCAVVVTGATGPLKRIRPVMSAANADAAWNLRCEVREKLIDWIVADHPDCMPSLRIEGTDTARP